MAEPIPFKEANVNFTAPDAHPEVLDLPALRTDTNIISCWRLTKPEIEEVARSGILWLSIMSSSQPPAMITPFKPFTEAGAGGRS